MTFDPPEPWAMELAELDILVTELDPSTLDEQPFGIIGLDPVGRVLEYSLYEQRLARMRREDVLGKNFFLEVAPCTRVKAFYGRFLDGVARRSLRARFGFVFPFPHGERAVEIAMVYRREDDTVWVLVRG